MTTSEKLQILIMLQRRQLRLSYAREEVHHSSFSLFRESYFMLLPKHLHYALHTVISVRVEAKIDFVCILQLHPKLKANCANLCSVQIRIEKSDNSYLTILNNQA